MIAVARLIAVAVLAAVAGANPAFARWRYAEWGMSEEKIISASKGLAMPCPAGVPVCSSTLTGAAPKLFVELVDMVGLHGATAFFFDPKGGLVQTVVLFPSVEFAQAASTIQGIHGQPVEDRPVPLQCVCGATMRGCLGGPVSVWGCGRIAHDD